VSSAISAAKNAERYRCCRNCQSANPIATSAIEPSNGMRGQLDSGWASRASPGNSPSMPAMPMTPLITAYT
jgi:hypothetical protein